MSVRAFALCGVCALGCIRNLPSPGAGAGRVVGLAEYAVLDHQDFAYTIAWSPDSEAVAYTHLTAKAFAASWWSGAGLHVRKRAELNGTDADVEALAFSPDGRALASASRDGSLRLHDVATGVLSATCPVGEPLTAVAFAPSGNEVWVGTASGWVKALSLPGCVPGDQVRHGSEEVRALAVAPDGRLFAGGWEQTLAQYAPPQGLKRVAAWSMGACVNDVTLDRAGRVLGVALSEGKAERSFEIYQREKRGQVELSRPGDRAALVEGEGGRPLRTWFAHRGVVATAAVSPDGQTLASGGWDKRLVVNGVAGGEAFERTFGWSVRRVRFSPDGRFLAVAAWTPQTAGESTRPPSAVVYRVLYASP